jgi:hypothetical protein
MNEGKERGDHIVQEAARVPKDLSRSDRIISDARSIGSL